MYKKNNKTCYTCGKVYTYCPSCAEFANQPKYLNMCHDENCMNIFKIVSAYAIKQLSPIDAANKLKECNLDIEIKKEMLKNQINEIFSLAKVAEDTTTTATTKSDTENTTETNSKEVTPRKMKSVNVSRKEVEKENK